MENFKKGLMTTFGVLAAWSICSVIYDFFDKDSREYDGPQQGYNRCYGDTEEKMTRSE